MKRGAEDLAHCGWIPPAEFALLALARGGSAAWFSVRRDPGTVLHLLSGSPLARLLPDHFSPTDLIESPEVLEAAVARLASAAPLDWSDPRRVSIYTSCISYAREAHVLAEHLGTLDPERAWTAGLLAPLGWIAIAAHCPDEITTGWLDEAELARRLARNWGLPPWLTSIIGHLGLSPDLAGQLGADTSLFAVTQLAVARVQQRTEGLALPLGASPAELLRYLHLPRIEETNCTGVAAAIPPVSLTEFLSVEAARRRLESRRVIRLLEDELDELHALLEEQRGREEERLQERKLKAIAEFAAGAGHEINNPLAVISCQAQLLLAHEADPGRRESLEKIIGQTRRIHGLLRGLMQFSRPPAPVRQVCDLVRIIDEVATSLGELAQQYRVRIRVRDLEDGKPPVAPAPCRVECDENQVRTALECLVKNAIQAAGAEGWVRVRLTEAMGRVELSIEDSGPGMSESQREHLFDPFYSGRSAGRGPGLGLPTAWSLARQQGGEVVLSSQGDEPTRFTLRLPAPAQGRKVLSA